MSYKTFDKIALIMNKLYVTLIEQIYNLPKL